MCAARFNTAGAQGLPVRSGLPVEFFFSEAEDKEHRAFALKSFFSSLYEDDLRKDPAE